MKNSGNNQQQFISASANQRYSIGEIALSVRFRTCSMPLSDIKIHIVKCVHVGCL